MKKLIIAAAVATMIAPAAHALVIDQSDSDSVGFDPTELSATFSFGGYTGSETITSVALTLFGAIDGTITLTNGANSPQTVSASSISDFFFSSADVAIPSTPPPQVSASGATGPVNLPALGSEMIDVDGDQTTVLNYGPGDPQLAQLLNPFQISLFTLTGFSSTGGGGNITVAQDTDAFASVTVDYGFEPGGGNLTSVPLPAAAWMLLAGLGALFAFRRNAKA